MSPADPILQSVDAAARRDGIGPDAEQLAVARRMALAATRSLRGEPARGVYVHGPAGRGKPWLARVALEEFCARAAGRPDAFRMESRLRLLHPV